MVCIQIIILSIPTGADQSRIMQEQMSGAAMAMPADTNKAFKVRIVVWARCINEGGFFSVVHVMSVLGFQAEWEALELTDHQWALESVEEDLMSRELDFDGMFSKELPSGIFWWPAHFYLEPSIWIFSIIAGICFWEMGQIPSCYAKFTFTYLWSLSFHMYHLSTISETTSNTLVLLLSHAN